ncbi:alpha-hydroxy acid oxidase [Kordiimonas aquimaris]|uniref:alpha-hydroxy acid oxidase n=1 Tax=Kordiimonas aquimaris TaxID=707591 RepID=UPI0021D370B4|nr:alpha-hydroxy acid oxidase [Kordiimonas aquimaris]
MRLSKCHNISDLRTLAQRRLPAPMFHYIDGGADDEWSLHNNTAAFDKYELMPNVLVDVDRIDLKTKLLGTEIALPFFLSPTGMSRLFHHDKELAVARAADKFGTAYALSTLGTTRLEDIADAIDVPKIFQLYIMKDRGLTREFVARCKAAGYTALCLTADTPVAGNRERDLRTGMTMPPKFGLKGLLNFAMHPHWSLSYLRHPNFDLANVAHRTDALSGGSMGLIDYVNSQFDRTVSWKDVEWLVGEWGGPFIIKGLQSVPDALKARDVGATALMISNHGGRQLESAPAPIDCVKDIRAAVGNDLELIVDGGIRRGNHIVKALNAGADACSIGRAYLYGLAAGGQAGVERALTILKTETERTMALMGCPSINDIKG